MLPLKPELGYPHRSIHCSLPSMCVAQGLGQAPPLLSVKPWEKALKAASEGTRSLRPEMRMTVIPAEASAWPPPTQDCQSHVFSLIQ